MVMTKKQTATYKEQENGKKEGTKGQVVMDPEAHEFSRLAFSLFAVFCFFESCCFSFAVYGLQPLDPILQPPDQLPLLERDRHHDALERDRPHGVEVLRQVDLRRAEDLVEEFLVFFMKTAAEFRP
ncbi:MAG: hypothetical protein MUE68_07225 [Bacteroidetes bacterium]|jgi:hypothetical protein|nr:hypothetical protein [Bacteroidota bacterium]